MYFRNSGLRKTWLDKCLKTHVSEDALKRNTVNDPKHCWDLHRSTFIIVNITAKKVKLEKFSVSDGKILGLSINTLATHDKYSLLNKDNLTLPIQMQLPKK